jgi:hypothetical protein
LEEMGFSDLTQDQLENLCEFGEKTARDYLLSKVPSRRIAQLEVAVETQGNKPVTVNVEVEVTLSPLLKGIDAQKLAKEAMERAFEEINDFLCGLKCKSTR